MRISSLLGLSGGWLLTSVLVAFDVGRDDPLFIPTLALGLPALVGLVVGVRSFRGATPPEPLQLGRLLVFGVLGAVVVTGAVLAIVAALLWGQPLPPG